LSASTRTEVKPRSPPASDATSYARRSSSSRYSSRGRRASDPSRPSVLDSTTCPLRRAVLLACLLARFSSRGLFGDQDPIGTTGRPSLGQTELRYREDPRLPAGFLEGAGAALYVQHARTPLPHLISRLRDFTIVQGFRHNAKRPRVSLLSVLLRDIVR